MNVCKIPESCPIHKNICCSDCSVPNCYYECCVVKDHCVNWDDYTEPSGEQCNDDVNNNDIKNDIETNQNNN